MEITNFAQPATTQNPVIQGSGSGTTALSSNNNPVVNTITVPTDSFSITSRKSIVVQQVVTQQVEIALNINSTGSTTGPAGDSPDQLINTVLQKIDDEISDKESDDSSDDDHHAAVVRDVSVKVEQGFQQATTVLNRMGILDESTKSDVEQTRLQVNDAIGQAGNALPSVTASVETASLNAMDASRELSSSIQITTQDGDVVTIDLIRSQSLSAGNLETADISITYVNASSSSQLSISVQGELSEKESESIREVVKRINKMAEKLLDGKTGAAMEKLSELEINTKQLASMSLSMSSSISYAAVSAYTQVSNISVEPAAVTAPVVSPVVENTPTVTTAPVAEQTTASQTESSTAVAVSLTQETAKEVGEIADSDDFENPFKEIRKLFANIADGIMKHDNHHVSEDHNDFIKQLFEDVVEMVEDREASDDVEESESLSHAA